MIEALKLALEALEKSLPRLAPYGEQDWLDSKAAITSLRQAIREHAMYEVQRLGQEIEQEPVAWMKPDVLCDRACMYLCTKGFTQFPECATTHPPQRTWQGLTDEDEIDWDGGDLKSLITAVEAKLKELNT